MNMPNFAFTVNYDNAVTSVFTTQPFSVFLNGENRIRVHVHMTTRALYHKFLVFVCAIIQLSDGP